MDNPVNVRDLEMVVGGLATPIAASAAYELFPAVSEIEGIDVLP